MLGEGSMRPEEKLVVEDPKGEYQRVASDERVITKDELIHLQRVALEKVEKRLEDSQRQMERLKND